jgi:biopolymer transport protein ExbD
MIDVMLILLVFFMVTSTYLNLDMIPIVDRVDDAPSISNSGSGSTILVRIGADGQTYLHSKVTDASSLRQLIKARLLTEPLLSVVILPSSRASTQALVSTMDTLTHSGVTRLRLMRLDRKQ